MKFNNIKAAYSKPAVKGLIAAVAFLACVFAVHGDRWVGYALACLGGLLLGGVLTGLVLAFGHLDWFGKAPALKDEDDIRSIHYRSPDHGPY